MIGLLFALIVFGFGTFGVGCLLLVTWFLHQRLRHTPEATLLRDTMIIHICAALCLLVECATLVWDSLFRVQFPIGVRWCVLLLLVPFMTGAAIRLLGHYIKKAATPPDEGNGLSVHEAK